MGKLIAIAAIGFLAIVVAEPGSAQTGVSDWSDERGPTTAARLIEGCLKTATGTREANIACLGVAFDACTRENGGTMSQYDLNVCRKYSYRAWRDRYERTLAGFDKLFRTWARPDADEWQRATAARFRSQEDAWQRWTAADCEMWELGSVGGTIHNYAVASCSERHIAMRTLNLTPLLEWFESR